MRAPSKHFSWEAQRAQTKFAVSWKIFISWRRILVSCFPESMISDHSKALIKWRTTWSKINALSSSMFRIPKKDPTMLFSDAPSTTRFSTWLNLNWSATRVKTSSLWPTRFPYIRDLWSFSRERSLDFMRPTWNYIICWQISFMRTHHPKWSKSNKYIKSSTSLQQKRNSYYRSTKNQENR